MRIRIHSEVCQGEGRICRFDPNLITLDDLISKIATKLMQSDGHDDNFTANRSNECHYDLKLQGCMVIKDVRAIEKDDHIVLVRKKVITIDDDDEDCNVESMASFNSMKVKSETSGSSSVSSPSTPMAAATKHGLPLFVPVVSPSTIKSEESKPAAVATKSKPEPDVASSLSEAVHLTPLPDSKPSARIAPAASPWQSSPHKKVKMEDGGALKKPMSFSKESFLSENILHLNPFITGGANLGFGPFIATGIASPGFYPIGPEVMRLLQGCGGISTSRTAVVKEITRTTQNGERSWAQQLGTWLQCATEPGCFIIMRHEYKNCPFVPAGLKDNGGSFIGPVYAIGQVTKAGLIDPSETQNLQLHLYENFPFMQWNSNSPVKVHWKWMGLKSNLQEPTQRYLNYICQPTVAKICGHGKEWPKLGTNWRAVREDLWTNAMASINPLDFS